MFGGRANENGTGRDGKKMEIIVAWMGRDRTVGVNFLDGTGRYAYFFTAQESAMQHTLTSAPRQQCYKLQVIAVRRILPSYNIRYHTCVINGCKFVRSNL